MIKKLKFVRIQTLNIDIKLIKNHLNWCKLFKLLYKFINNIFNVAIW